MINQEDIISLAAYNPHYPARFRQEVHQLESLLGPLAHTFYHIGSTAIVPIEAKPIIDIALEVHQFPLTPALIQAMQEVGYRYWDQNPDLDTHFFVKGMPRTYHLHVYAVGNAKLASQLCFRDYLLAHPAEAKQYELLKKDLARRFRTDREAYTQGKTAYIQELLASLA